MDPKKLRIYLDIQVLDDMVVTCNVYKVKEIVDSPDDEEEEEED